MMFFRTIYQSPLGEMILVADEKKLRGAWFVGQKYEQCGYEKNGIIEEENAVLLAAKKWLDAYFAGENPQAFTSISPQGTEFQQRVWQELEKIPAGSTVTYGELAAKLNCRSAQAVGGAVGKNPLSIFVPCHRVLGCRGQLTGYAGGLERKIWLLRHERVPAQLFSKKK